MNMKPFSPLRALVYAPKGHGKTTAALTLSEKCPEKFPADKPVELDDLFFISADAGGLDTLVSYNVTVPGIDLSSVEPAKLGRALDEAIDVAKKRAQEGKTKTIIVDTLSSIDAIAEYHCVSSTEEADKRKGYGDLLAFHSKAYYRLMSQNPANVLILCHAKYLVEDSSPKTKGATQANRASQLAPGRPQIVPALTGKGAQKWLHNVSLELPLVAAKVGSKMVREFFTETAGWEAKCRSTALKAREPADFRIILPKLRNGGNQ